MADCYTMMHCGKGVVNVRTKEKPQAAQSRLYKGEGEGRRRGGVRWNPNDRSHPQGSSRQLC